MTSVVEVAAQREKTAQLTRDELIELVAALEAENADLDGKLQYALKALHGPSSERTKRQDDPGQEQLFGLPTAQEPEPVATEHITYERDKTKPTTGHGRQQVSRELRAVEKIIPVAESDKIGPDGEPLVLTGYEISEKLDLIPEEIVRLVIKRERYGVKATRETVVTAAVEPCLVPKGKATDAFIHEIIVRKYLLGLPLYRQASDLNSRGAEVNDSWLVDCVKHAADHYRPIAEAIRDQVLNNPFVHADETPIRQQTGDGVKTGYFWCWLAGGQVFFHYGGSRGQCEVARVFGMTDDDQRERGEWIGFLICDGYAGYNALIAQGGIIRVACWAHLRRKFKDLDDTDRNAAALVERINDAFRVDRETRKQIEKQRLTPEAAAKLHQEHRQHYALPIIADIRTRMTRLAPLYTPASRMRKAIEYANHLWQALTVYLTDGRLPMDNNAAERAIRPLVIGRKNYLFVGSEDGGEWAAICYSIIESCRMQKIDPRRYLTQVTPLLVSGNKDYARLTPTAMKDQLRTTS